MSIWVGVLVLVVVSLDSGMYGIFILKYLRGYRWVGVQDASDDSCADLTGYAMEMRHGVSGD